MERVRHLVGRGSRITQGIGEAFDVELKTRRARPQNPPSRGPVPTDGIQSVAANYAPTRIVAGPRFDGPAVVGRNKPIDRQRKLTLPKVFGLIEASPHQLFRP
jgi:hypothetical protein